MSENTELTAQAIWDNRDEWLEMALLVYEAMPKLREYLFKEIMEDISKRFKDAVAGAEGGTLYWEEKDSAYGVHFWDDDTWQLSLCVEVEVAGKRGRRKWLPRVALHADKRLNKAYQQDLRARFDAIVGGQSEFKGNYIAIHYVEDERVPPDWNGDGSRFLSQAIRHREEIVSCLSDLAIQVWRDLHTDMKRIAKSAWGRV